MYCFPRLKDLPTPNFVFRLENETGKERKKERGGGEDKTNILMWNDKGLFLSHFPLRWRTRQPLRLRDCRRPANPAEHPDPRRDIISIFSGLEGIPPSHHLVCQGAIQVGINYRAAPLLYSNFCLLARLSLRATLYEPR